MAFIYPTFFLSHSVSSFSLLHSIQKFKADMYKFYAILCILICISCEKETKYTAQSIKTIQLNEQNSFGNKPSLLSEPFTVKHAIEKRLLDTPIRVIGNISSSCQAKGCWMYVTEEDYNIKVTFDGEFTVPLNFQGSYALIEGVLTEHEIPESIRETIGSTEKNEYKFTATSVLKLK